MMVPTIHLNGTSREALLEQVCNAGHAARILADALSEMAPNGRDYYPQGDHAYPQARAEHDARLNALTAVQQDLEAMYLEIETRNSKDKE